MKQVGIFLISLIHFGGFAQSYTSYFTGNTTDMIVSPIPPGGLCMMGGASENDEAMKWFLERAYGGDVLVIRASGSDGYNNYMYSGLGINVNSVETIVFNNSSAAYDPYVLDKLSKAEAVWIAGGDQWDYVSYWRGTPVDSLINDGITNRGMTIGGTSAGMAIQGRYYFSAENGTVTSNTALQNPFDSNITVDSACFIKNEFLQDVVTDSHYDDPDRKGRHVVFLSHILQNYGLHAKGIACNEYTAVCVDENGLARVFGEYPQYDEFAYFIAKNCELDGTAVNPEVYSSGAPLTWNYLGEILKAYKVPGTMSGSNTFDLSDWQTGSGGEWYNWSVDAGNFSEVLSTAPVCTSNISEATLNDFSVSPIPTQDEVHLQFSSESERTIELIDLNGNQLSKTQSMNAQTTVDLSTVPKGVYLVKVSSKKGVHLRRVMKN